eukprot:g30620.t1
METERSSKERDVSETVRVNEVGVKGVSKVDELFTFHPNLKFTWAISDTSLPFVDLSVSISGDRLKTDIHFKPTDSHSYLDHTSSHPPSCKNA